MVARRDGQPINWPTPTHGKPDHPAVINGQRKPWRTAAEIIDWSIPCPSIFDRKRPLADNTLRRIARGIQKFVIDDPRPFIVRICHSGWGGDGMQYALDAPLTTITTKAEHCLVAPFISRYFGTATGRPANTPLGTTTAGGGKSALVAAFLAKHYTGVTGQTLTAPLGTVTTIDHHSLVTAFLIKYYSEGGQWQRLDEPLHTIPTKDRLGLVTVSGEQYRIIDIGMRMLQPHELYAAQGFPDDYRFAQRANGSPFTKTQQVAMVGNSVPPPIAEALVRANLVAQQPARVA
jgi:DNA (cytosine-5)-methyltransferase 1